MKLRAALALALGAVLIAIPGAFGGSEPGVTPTSISLGGTVPLSGPETAFGVVAPGAAAYFKYVNDHGGVFKRKISYEYLDDAYDPAQTVSQTRRLVEQDKVFAIFNSVGTEEVLAVRPYLNQQGVPQLFTGSGLTALSREAKQYPWTIGYLVAFSAEGRVFGSYLAKTRPSAKIAVLYEDSDYSKELLAGLKSGLGGKGKIVDAETYNVTDPTVDSPVSKLQASGADTLILFALPKQTIQSFITIDKLGWNPHVFITSISIDPAVMQIARLNTQPKTTEGAMSIAFLKDPTNPRWANDAGVKLYLQVMKHYAPGDDPKAVAHFYGMAAAYTMVDALKHAGKNLTRQGLLNAATHLNESDNPFLLPGIVVKTTPTYRFPIQQVQLYRYHAGLWRPLGGLVAARP